MKSKELMNLIKSKEGNSPFDANTLYREVEGKMSELAYFKALNRFSQIGELQRVGKGVYCFPASEEGPSDEDIMAPYLKNKRGMKIGYALYKELGLVKDDPTSYALYTNHLTGRRKTIKGISIKKVSLSFDEKTKQHVALLEVLEEFTSIEDLDLEGFIAYCESFSKIYDQSCASRVIKNIPYKKRTLSFLKDVLDYYGVENSLSRYLSPLSIYRHPKMAELCAR